MWAWRVTVVGVACVALGMQAVRWLTGFSAPCKKDRALKDSKVPISSSSIITKSKDTNEDCKKFQVQVAEDQIQNLPRILPGGMKLVEEKSFGADNDREFVLYTLNGMQADSESAAASSSSRQNLNDKRKSSKNRGPTQEDPGTHDGQAPKMSSPSEENLHKDSSDLSRRSQDTEGHRTSTEDLSVPEPETPKRKTRVKRIRFEQPDINGHYSDHFQISRPQVSEKGVSEDAKSSQEALQSPQRSEPSSSGSSLLQQSPYANNTVEWSLPPFSNGRQLGIIPEEPRLGLRRNGHKREVSFGESVNSTDEEPTPFSTQEFHLLSAPTQAGEAVNDEQVGTALAEVGQNGPPRRHSRSFSEPNLAGMLANQAQINKDPDLEHALRTGLGEEESSDASPDYFRAQNTDVEDHAKDHSNERSQGGNEMPNSFQTELSNSSSLSGDEAHPLLRLEVITGPSRGQDFTIGRHLTLVKIGRLSDNEVHFEDNEVSSRHAELEWCPKRKCWLVRDMGSLNGTRLNGNFISNSIRKPGKTWKLNSDDILLLGHRTSIKVAYLPNTDLPTVHSNLKLYAPPSGLESCVTMKSEAIASLRAELGIEKTLQEKSLRLDVACVSHVGVEHKRRGQICEDMPFLGESGRSGAALYCVFDGHCGSNSSKECVSILPECLRRRMRDTKSALDNAEGLGQIWEEVFLETDKTLQTEDGTTATSVLVWKDSTNNICIQAANVGDSAAVIWRQDEGFSNCRQITTDHRISSPEERKRLKSIGIDLAEGTSRLYGLNVARCLGDHYLKEFGFSAVPSVSEVVKLSPQESGLLVLASDGVWDVAEPSKVIEVAAGAKQQSESNTESIAQAVHQLALDKRSRDDITVIVLSFHSEENLRSA